MGGHHEAEGEDSRGVGAKKGQPISYQNEERDAWLLVINLQRAFYMAQFERGQLSSAAFEVLEDFMAKTTAIAGSVPVSELSELYDLKFKNILLKRMRKSRPEVTYEAAVAYLFSLDEVSHVLEADGHVDEFEKKVKDELKDNIEDMEALMKELREKYPKEIRRCQAVIVKTKLLYKQQEIVDHLLHEGELLDLDACQLQAQIDDELQHLYLEPVGSILQWARAASLSSPARCGKRSGIT